MKAPLLRPKRPMTKTVAEVLMPDGRTWKIRAKFFSLSGGSWFLQVWTAAKKRRA